MYRNGDQRTHNGRKQVYVADADRWYDIGEAEPKVAKKAPIEDVKLSNDLVGMPEDYLLSEHSFVKADSGKLQWSLLPFAEVEEVVKVLMKGASKYSPDNWKKCDNTKRYEDALMRHVIAYIKGNKIDEVSQGGDGLPHLAHAICNCLFLMWFDNQQKEER